jgi:hypothetical protein
MIAVPKPRVAPSALADRFARVRARSLALAAPHTDADCQQQ